VPSDSGLNVTIKVVESEAAIELEGAVETEKSEVAPLRDTYGVLPDSVNAAVPVF
jgi:hypothetical protein